MGASQQPVRRGGPPRKRNWLQVEAAGVALLAVVVCVALGVRARSQAQVARDEARRIQGIAQSITQFESAFQPVTSGERKRWSMIPDSSALGVAPENRVGLTESVARIAEQSGLVHSRVSFGVSDSLPNADRGAVAGRVAAGNYTIAIDADGGFAELLTFVNALPVAVSVTRLTGWRDTTGARFHVILAVYENKDASHS